MISISFCLLLAPCQQFSMTLSQESNWYSLTLLIHAWQHVSLGDQRDQRDQCLFPLEWRLMWWGLLKWNNHSEDEVVCSFLAKQSNIPLTDRILHQLICNTSPDLQGFSHFKWCRILSINIRSVKLINICVTKDCIANHSGQLLNLDILEYWNSLNL